MTRLSFNVVSIELSCYFKYDDNIYCICVRLEKNSKMGGIHSEFPKNLSFLRVYNNLEPHQQAFSFDRTAMINERRARA